MEITRAASKINKKTNKLLLPGKLVSCKKSTPIEDRELYIVEGDSAGGTAKKARFKEYQEVLPIRGKIVNAAKTSLPKTLGSETVQNILISRKWRKV